MIGIIKILAILSLLLYIGAVGCYALSFSKGSYHVIGRLLTILGLAASILIIGYITLVNGRLPLTNGTEFLLVITSMITIMYLIYDGKNPASHAAWLLLLLIVVLSLVTTWQTINITDWSAPLMPALQSPWLTVHVLTAAIAYSSFALAAVLAFIKIKSPTSPIKDDSIYRLVFSGFAWLSLSIVLGAIWAEQAWGTYWSWDPKETWALITWIVYALYLHLHRKPGWSGKSSHWLVVFGFALVMFTFFGVNYLMNGLHSYS